MEGFLEETLCLFASDTPGPTWALLAPARTMRIIGDVASKCIMKPVYQLLVSIRDTDKQPIGWVPLLRSTWATSYHDRAFTIKQASYVRQRFNTQHGREHRHSSPGFLNYTE